MIKPRETFYINPPTQIKEDCMIGLIGLEVYNFLNIHHENKKFELYTYSFDDISFEELKNELELMANLPDTTPEDLEDDILSPRVIQAYRKLKIQKGATDGFMRLLMAYSEPSFRDFESYLRIVAGLNEDDIQLILKQYNSHFITYEIPPSFYTIKDLSDIVYTKTDDPRTLQLEYVMILVRK